MKLAKTASGKQTVKISKSEWLSIGRTAGWVEKLVSDCCGEHDRMMSEDGPFYSDTGICPRCKEHCQFVQVDDLIGDDEEAEVTEEEIRQHVKSASVKTAQSTEPTESFNEKRARLKSEKHWGPAPLPEACGNCQSQGTARGLYHCVLHDISTSLTYRCDDYQRDPSKPAVIDRN